MSKYSQAVIAKKPEFSYLDTDAPLRETYGDGTVNPYNPEVFPYAESFMRTVLKRVNDTYAAVVEDEHRQTLCRELYRQLKHDFRFDFPTTSDRCVSATNVVPELPLKKTTIICFIPATSLSIKLRGHAALARSLICR